VKAGLQLKELGQDVQAVGRAAKRKYPTLLNKVSDPITDELQSTMKALLASNVDVRTLTDAILIKVKEIHEISDKTDLMCAVKTQFEVELPEYSVVG